MGTQRVYHVTHAGNLPSILDSGTLFSDSDGSFRPAVDISSEANRATRRELRIARFDTGDGDGTVVADYVPFFLAPNSSVWDAIRGDDSDARLSRAATGAAASDFIILVSTVKMLEGHFPLEGSDGYPIVVTDGDATAPATRFGVSRESATRMLGALRANENPAIFDAEYLVPGPLPFELVSLIGVANDRVRDTVRQLLAPSQFTPKVAVYPPWFQREPVLS